MSRVRFGTFLSQLLRDLGISTPRLADMIGMSYRTVHGWTTRKDPPRGESIIRLADALDIPLATFRAAVEGKSVLPVEYRERSRLLEIDRRSRVWNWFREAPEVVQRVVLAEGVPAGLEDVYLKRACAYFGDRLSAKGAKAKRAG